VSWGSSWGCPLMDKTCYAEVQGALCEQKDDRALRRLNQRSDKIVTKNSNNENMSRREDVIEDEVYYIGSGDTEEIIDSMYDDDFESMKEETDIVTNANGTIIEEVESYDIHEKNGAEEETEEVIYFEDGSEIESYDVYEKDGDEKITEELYYFEDESEEDLYIEENIENADGTSEDIEYDSEYENIDGEEEEVYSEEYYKKADGSSSAEVDIYSYDSNDGAAELVGAELYDEETDKDGNVVVEETYYEVENGVMEIVEEDEYSIDADDDEEFIDVDDGVDDEVELLEEELEEEEEKNEVLEEEVEDVEDSLYYEELEEEVLEEELEEEYYENTYIFDDDFYEDEYWSSNNWDEKWEIMNVRSFLKQMLTRYNLTLMSPPVMMECHLSKSTENAIHAMHILLITFRPNISTILNPMRKKDSTTVWWDVCFSSSQLVLHSGKVKSREKIGNLD